MARMDEATGKGVRADRPMPAGKTQAQAAHAVGVARQTAHTWKAPLDEGGIDALRAMAGGRPAQLDSSQLDGLRVALRQGALARGFGTEPWALKRVRRVIERMYVVTFSEVHVWRPLGAMGFSSHRGSWTAQSIRANRRTPTAMIDCWRRPASRHLCPTERLVACGTLRLPRLSGYPAAGPVAEAAGRAPSP